MKQVFLPENPKREGGSRSGVYIFNAVRIDAAT